MDPKKVWGLILIVLGVSAVIVGASNYRDYSMAADAYAAGTAAYQRLLGVKATSLDIIDVQGMLQREKGLSLMSIVVGLLFSIFGTLMLKSTMPRPVNAFDDDLEAELSDEPRFRL